MDLDNAATFMLGSIGYGVGFVFWVGVVVLINNILHKHWKPVSIFTRDSWFINPPTHHPQFEPLEATDGKSKEKRNA